MIRRLLRVLMLSGVALSFVTLGGNGPVVPLAGCGAVVKQNAASATTGASTLPTKTLGFSRVLVTATAKQQVEEENVSQEGNVGKLLFILAPFILGAVDLVAHDQLVSFFNA